ncbi:hypothetical protein D3C85_1404630 [compost metagenome]
MTADDRQSKRQSAGAMNRQGDLRQSCQTGNAAEHHGPAAVQFQLPQITAAQRRRSRNGRDDQTSLFPKQIPQPGSDLLAQRQGPAVIFPGNGCCPIEACRNVRSEDRLLLLNPRSMGRPDFCALQLSEHIHPGFQAFR